MPRVGEDPSFDDERESHRKSYPSLPKAIKAVNDFAIEHCENDDLSAAEIDQERRGNKW